MQAASAAKQGVTELVDAIQADMVNGQRVKALATSLYAMTGAPFAMPSTPDEANLLILSHVAQGRKHQLNAAVRKKQSALLKLIRACKVADVDVEDALHERLSLPLWSPVRKPIDAALAVYTLAVTDVEDAASVAERSELEQLAALGKIPVRPTGAAAEAANTGSGKGGTHSRLGGPDISGDIVENGGDASSLTNTPTSSASATQTGTGSPSARPSLIPRPCPVGTVFCPALPTRESHAEFWRIFNQFKSGWAPRGTPSSVLWQGSDENTGPPPPDPSEEGSALLELSNPGKPMHANNNAMRHSSFPLRISSNLLNLQSFARLTGYPAELLRAFQRQDVRVNAVMLQIDDHRLQSELIADKGGESRLLLQQNPTYHRERFRRNARSDLLKLPLLSTLLELQRHEKFHAHTVRADPYAGQPPSPEVDPDLYPNLFFPALGKTLFPVINAEMFRRRRARYSARTAFAMKTDLDADEENGKLALSEQMPLYVPPPAIPVPSDGGPAGGGAPPKPDPLSDRPPRKPKIGPIEQGDRVRVRLGGRGAVSDPGFEGHVTEIVAATASSSGGGQSSSPSAASMNVAAVDGTIVEGLSSLHAARPSPSIAPRLVPTTGWKVPPSLVHLGPPLSVSSSGIVRATERVRTFLPGVDHYFLGVFLYTGPQRLKLVDKPFVGKYYYFVL